MNGTERCELWKRLQQAGLVTGELPEESGSPWYIRAMLGFAGWNGAFFLLGFVGSAFAVVMQHAGAAVVAAVCCCGAAAAIFRFFPRGDFPGQFGLAMGLAGQALFAVAIFQKFSAGGLTGYLLFFCVEAVMTPLLSNFAHRFFTTLAGVTVLSFGLAQVGVNGVALPLTAGACALVWRGEWRAAGRVSLWQPVGYGLAMGVLLTATISVLGGALEGLFPGDKGGWLQRHGVEMGTALVAVVFLAVIVDILRQLEIDPLSSDGLAILACGALFLIVTFTAHGMAAAALILILGFAGGNRVLCGLGFLALASFLSHYYYQMKETLLFKSLILGGTGMLLLLLRWGVREFFPAGEGTRHA